MVDVLVFSAHPDDAEFGMGATLTKLRAQGHSLAICVLTNGQAGTHGSEEIRKQETKAAAKHLGAQLELLNLQDCNIHDNQENRILITNIIRKHQPTTIFAPHYASNGAPRSGEAHPDHAATGALVQKAVRFARFKNLAEAQGEAHKTTNLYYYMLADIKPTLYVDVSDYQEAHEALAKKHASQTALKQGRVLQIIKQKQAMTGLQAGCAYAEAFTSDELQPLNLQKE